MAVNINYYNLKKKGKYLLLYLPCWSHNFLKMEVISSLSFTNKNFADVSYSKCSHHLKKENCSQWENFIKNIILGKLTFWIKQKLEKAHKICVTKLTVYVGRKFLYSFQLWEDFLTMLPYLKLAIIDLHIKENNSDKNRLGCLCLLITICIENLFEQFIQ